MKKLLPLVIFLIFSVQLFAGGNPDAIVGVWANSSNKAHIQIYKHQNIYYGKIIWLNKPTDVSGKPKVDRKNPDEKFRNNRIIGLVVLRDFRYDEEQWKNGKIYNPEDGKEYKSIIKLKDDKTLLVRGYIGFTILGKTENFIRVS